MVDGLSVSISSETTLENVTRNYPEDSVVEFEVGIARSLECIIYRDPTTEDPAHAIVWGPRARGRLSKNHVDTLRNSATVRLYRWPTRETP